jgi:uncharacterized membrane protein YkoI
MLLTAVLLLATDWAGAVANDDDKRCKHDQDCALGAFERGEIRSFAEVLDSIRQQAKGQIVKVELERDDGLWVYKIKLLADDGRRKKIEVDAKSLAILKLKDD